MPVLVRAVDSLRRRDPRGVALRRAARVAIAVPVSLLVLTNLPATAQSGLFGVFATLALLVFADFGGPLRLRAAAYLTTIIAAIPILYIGVVFGQSVPGAVIVMAVVALLLGVAGVLRGVLAAAQTTLLLATVLAVTSAPPGTQWTVILSWVVGGAIAMAAALLLWPARPSGVIHRGIAQVFHATAEAVVSRWSIRPDRVRHARALNRLDEALRALHGTFDGNLLRPAGLTSSDRSLAELVDVAGRLRRYQLWIDVVPQQVPPDPQLQASVSHFAAVVAQQMQAIGRRLDGTGPPPTPEDVQRARERNLAELAQWAQDSRGTVDPELMRERIDDIFPLRLTSVSTELAAVSVGGRTDFHDKTLGQELEHPRRGAAARLRTHVSWDSPWFRNALRAAVALAISVFVAKSLALGHEFWIVLGTLTALRFDALGTGRTAAQALIGTTGGVALASLLIVAFGDSTIAWWIMLPIALFISAFTPGTFSLAYGQAAFSLTVLVLFSLLFPTNLQTAELRIVDVAIGLAVSLVTSLIMWPRGVVVTLYRRMQEAMAAATDHLVMSIDYVAGGGVDEAILDDYSERAYEALDRAQESYDLSLASKPPKTVSLREWARVALATRHVDIAAHLIPGIEQIVTARGDERVIPTELVGPMLDASHDMRDRLRSAVATWSDAPVSTDEDIDIIHSDAAELEFTIPDSVVALRAAIVHWLARPSDWTGTGPDPRPVTVTWVGDWTAFIAWSAELLRRDLVMGAGAPPDAALPSA